MSDELTFSERHLLYLLIDAGARYDNDTADERVLINRGLAERFANPFAGHTMVRASGAGHRLHDTAFPPAHRGGQAQ